MRETPLILVVDDDPGILQLVRDILSPSYQVITAGSVKEAQERLRVQGFDLVLTDMVMPEVGGLELLKYLRLHHSDTPVIVFTGYANFHDAVNAVKLGAFDYLTKPIQIEILQHAIARALEFRRLYSQQKDLEVVFRGAETLGWQALDLISGTEEAALLTSLRESWAEAGALTEVGQRFLDGIEKLLGATRTSIFLYDGERDHFSGLVAKGPEAQARLAKTVPANNSLMGYVADQRRPLLVVDLELDQRVALWTRRFPYHSKSFMIIPLIGSKFWGVINLTDRKDDIPFTPRDLFLAWLFGHLLVEALEAKGVVRKPEPSPPLGALLQEHFPQGVALVDRDLRIIQANSALVKLLRAKGEPVGQEMSALLGLAPEERDNLKDVLAWVMEHQEARELPTLKCSLEEGKIHFLGVKLIPSLHPQNSNHGIIVLEDLSELEKLKQRLHLYEHLAIMGKLSLCVAHELNNPLDGVYRFLTLALKKKDNPEEVERYLNEAQKGLQKMSMTIRSLLSSANPLKAPPKTDNLLNLLQEAVKIMMFQANDQRVQVSLHAPQDLQQVPVEGDLYHVFVNIIKNALQAMPQGGELKVDGNIGAQDIAIHFQDSGSGLSHEELGQIFQPFYSTKEGTQGLGLGLPICRKILERYAGQLIVESQPGRGTRVSILLPKSGLGEHLAG
jgi:signal transduction histidine kinase/CheY-like chemotaxis protein